jgi:hypothetical protein
MGYKSPVNHSLINPYKQIWIRTENDVPGEFHLYDTLFLNQGIGEIIVDLVILNRNLEHFPIQLYLGTLPINTVGIEQAVVVTNRHFIYPNPTNSIVQLKVNSEIWPVSFEIFDLKGSSMKQGVLTYSSSSLDIRNLSKGTYIIHFKTESDAWTEKLVVD